MMSLLTQYDSSILPILFPEVLCQATCLPLWPPTGIAELCWVQMESRSVRGRVDVGGRYAEANSSRLLLQVETDCCRFQSCEFG